MLASLDLSELSSLPLPRKHYAYGTAGFRDAYDETFHSVFFKVGLIAALRSVFCEGQAVGVMITASHNAAPDNGVKIVDPLGEMLSQRWESFAEALVNAHTLDAVRVTMQSFVSQQTHTHAHTPIVVIGRDCRSHSPVLSGFVVRGIHALLGSAVAPRVIDLGEVTTPVVHFAVADFNKNGLHALDKDALKTRYYETLNTGYRRLLATQTYKNRDTRDVLTLDCAYGVPSLTVSEFLSVAEKETVLPQWTLSLCNRVHEGEVNALCGAEYVQKKQLPPHTKEAITDEMRETLWCSFDGDGDRVVLHFYERVGETWQWRLLDGDRIAALISLFLVTELRAAGIALCEDPHAETEASTTEKTICAGTVQTAYANGGSSRFIRSSAVNVPVKLAATGVKFVHHVAQTLDVGVYFEANGHGTVLFSECYVSLLNEKARESEKLTEREKLAVERLQALLQVINQTVGDALSDLLTVLAILKVMGMTARDWYSLYTDLPSKQEKLAVRDKSLLRCCADETRLVTPLSLQSRIDSAVAAVRCGRAFVRPSGTEDVVRIYAEAATPEEVDQLVRDVAAAIHDFFAQ